MQQLNHGSETWGCWKKTKMTSRIAWKPSKPVGTTVLSEKMELLETWWKTMRYHTLTVQLMRIFLKSWMLWIHFMVPRRGAEISLDTTWARNGCSTRLSDTPSSKRLFDLKNDEIRRLELWTCGKPTSVWIILVKFWSANPVWFLDKTFTTMLKLMRALRCFTKQLSPGECCPWLFQCYWQARQHGTPTVANEAQNPQSLTGKNIWAFRRYLIWWNKPLTWSGVCYDLPWRVWYQ